MRNVTLLLLLSILFSCDRDLPTPVVNRSAPVLETFSLPALLEPNREFILSVRVQSPLGPESVDSVNLNIYKRETTTPVQQTALYDDGAVLHPEDNDIIAHDGIFTQKIFWYVAGTTQQDFVFKLSAVDNNGRHSNELEQTIVSLTNVPPQILDVVMPDTLPSGFDGKKLFMVSVFDSNGVDNIKEARFQIIRNDTMIFQGVLGVLSPHPERSDVAVISMEVDSSFAAGLKDAYQMHFIAYDRSNTASLPAGRTVFFENEKPQLHHLDTITQLKRPSSGLSTFYVTVGVKDPQSLKDIKSVKMTWQKPSGSYSENSPFELYDNGLPFDLSPSKWNAGYRGDLLANDGNYSITAIFDSDDPLGNYTLTFIAQDHAGNKSESLQHIVNLH